MRLNKATLAGAAMLLALGLAACDGSENARTIPTAPPDYLSPALVGPEVPGEHGEGGEYGGENEGNHNQDSGFESEGADPNATQGPN